MAESNRRRASGISWIIRWLVLVPLVVASSIPAWTSGQRPTGSASTLSVGEAAPAERPDEFPVTTRHPSGPPVIELRQSDSEGHRGQVTCSTCHSVRTPNRENRKPSDLTKFHQGMALSHGELACYACHNPDDSDTLRLADGSTVEYVDVMNLCGQCHGRQFRNYARGFHGGMTGYWDLTRGGRVRNNCIDCHDPHVPRFPTMQPTFQTRDRFLTPSEHDVRLPYDELDDGEVHLE